MSGLRQTMVVAIGGNAIVTAGDHESIYDQAQAVSEVCGHIADVVEQGHKVVVTHGNGPQVGFILRRSEIAAGIVPTVPMDYATADTQGAIGFMFQRALYNEFHRRGLKAKAACVVTQVRVDPKDPAFLQPDKPIGQFYAAEQVDDLSKRLGWTMTEDSGRGWRRVVASPQALEIMELALIRSLLDEGYVVIACGGGGIPVRADERGMLFGVEAVIDKDRSSSLLARGIQADLLVLCTGVDKVFLDYGKASQRAVDNCSSSEAQTWLDEGQFGRGSMAPKIEAIVAFLHDVRKSRGLVTSLAKIGEALQGTNGTFVHY